MKLLEVIGVSFVATVAVTSVYSLAVLGIARRNMPLTVISLAAFFGLVIVGVDVMLSKS